MKRNRVVLATVAALALLSMFSLTVSAQNYKRHALIEEGTGNWCGYCPYGAYNIDTMTAYMGDKLVAISWHTPFGGEPMAIRAGDSVDAYLDVAHGVPWAAIGRRAAMSGSPEQGGVLMYPNQWSQLAESDAMQAPLADIRIVNATFSSNAVDFDVDITPIRLASMPTEDTAKYYTVSVVTEDGIVETQHIYDDPDATDISDFRHYNVARAVGGKALGDLFTFKNVKTWPIRRHYHIAINTSEWVKDSLRIKAFAAYKGNKSAMQTYLDADQTGYITTFPSSAPAAIWPVLPAKGQSISGDSIEIPIVWASGGGVSSAALDYSVDGGKTWNSIVSSTTQSPYEWQIPKAAYGQSVTLRVGDPSNVAKDSIGQTFSIGVAPTAVITVTSPAAGDSLLVGTTHAISFMTSGPINEGSLTVEYSTDSMATWNTITTLSNKTSYNWMIPSSPSMKAFVRVTDANNTVGISPMFGILDSGNVSNVAIDGAPNIPIGVHETIRWDVAGYTGETLNIDLYDPQTGIRPIAHGLPTNSSSYLWTTIPSIPASGYSVRVAYASGAAGTSAPFNIVASDVSMNSAPEGITLTPNPFASTSTLHFALATSANVTLVLRDLLGREVLRDAAGTLPAGNQHIDIDGSKLTSGTYEYALTIGTQTQTGKLSVIR